MLRLLFVTLFFVLTLLPGLQMLTGVAPLMIVNENRVLAPAVSTATPLGDIPGVADRWFSDHFGLRSLLIRLKTQIDFSLFGASDRVLVGRDGQLFYRSTTNDEVPAMNDYLADATVPSVAGVATLNRALAADGIRMAIVVNMLSDRFYPELLPRQALRRPDRPRVDDYVARLQKVPDLLVVDSKAILDELRKTRRIFHKTDFHWNDPAAFDVAKHLVDRMSVTDGMAASPWTYPLVIDTLKVSGGIATFMPLFVPPSELALMVKPNWQWPEGFVNLSPQPPFEFSSKADPNPALLPPTVVVGDSFFDGMVRSGIQACFVEMHRIRWTGTIKISEVIASLPKHTRWVIFEFIEVNRLAVGDFADSRDIEKSVVLLKERGPTSGP